MTLNYREVLNGIQNPKKASKYVANKLVFQMRDYVVSSSSYRQIGRNIFEENWDMVIILDACRTDIMQIVKDEYEYINEIEKVRSVGGTSPEWMVNTFNNKYKDDISNTGYITANPHSKSVFEHRLERHFRGEGENNRMSDLNRIRKYGRSDYVTPEEMGLYYPVWAEQDPSNDNYYDLYGSPRKLTDKVIRIDRERDLDKIVVHYMPPHTPYIINALREDRDPKQYEESPWEYIRKTGDRQKVKQVCADMLRWGIDEVKMLLENTSRERVIITSDHGDGFGEYGIYSHHAGSLHPFIRKVPWITTTATDNKTYEPDTNLEQVEEHSAKERLEALGYL